MLMCSVSAFFSLLFMPVAEFTAIIMITPLIMTVIGALLLPLLLVAANTGYQVLTSRLTPTDDPGTMHFYTGLVGLLLSSLVLPFFWHTLSWQLWGTFLLIAVFNSLGHFLLILAYARAPVVVLTPYLYLQVGFAALGGWLVFSHLPDAWA